ncbi:MAG: SDR family NAD(P)-dependent oxidoreductase [Gammaproteobacteria bacterium]
MDLQDKVAIVTGGASGLGRATVECLVKAGAKVGLFDINEEAGNALAAELGDAAIFCPVNITEDAAITTAISTVMDTFGAIHICVNCAGRGGGATKSLSKKGRFPIELFKDVININLVGTFNVLCQVAEKMADNEPDADGERGVIINTASIAAYEGQRGQAAYSASKGGIVSMTLPIARELAHYGIRVVSIAPGVFDTPILNGLTPEIKQALSKDIPFPKRLGEVADFAALTRHIVNNPYINGATIRLDGAMRMAAG